jgi:hypothetical protein
MLAIVPGKSPWNAQVVLACAYLKWSLMSEAQNYIPA